MIDLKELRAYAVLAERYPESSIPLKPSVVLELLDRIDRLVQRDAMHENDVAHLMCLNEIAKEALEWIEIESRDRVSNRCDVINEKARAYLKEICDGA